MELIERYIHAVISKLPKESRSEVSLELKANIEDMLPEKPTESDVRTVLNSLGNPYHLSSEYNTNKKYLIGPQVYDSYISVLKLVVGIVAAVFLSIYLIESIFTLNYTGNLVKFIINLSIDLFAVILEGIIQAFIWVTVTFVILERTGINEGDLPFSNKNWTIDNLPIVPMSYKKKISRGETIFSIVGTIFFTILIFFKSEFIGIYTEINGIFTLAYPLLVADRLKIYLIPIVLLSLFQLCIFVYKYITTYWNMTIATLNAMNNILSSLLLIVMMRDNLLFNQDALAYLTNILNITVPSISIEFSRLSIIFIFIFVIINIWDGIDGYIRAKK